MPDPGTGDHAPARAVPVFDQRGVRAASCLLSDGPDVVAGHAVYRGELAALDGGCGDDVPTRSVEVLGERLGRVAAHNVADRPDVAVRDRRRSEQSRIVDKWARNDV